MNLVTQYTSARSRKVIQNSFEILDLQCPSVPSAMQFDLLYLKFDDTEVNRIAQVTG